jgi:hypothetical protein
MENTNDDELAEDDGHGEQSDDEGLQEGSGHGVLHDSRTAGTQPVGNISLSDARKTTSMWATCLI